MLSKLFAPLDWRHWALSHAVWIVALAVALVMGRSYMAEHDARVLADASIKVSEANVASLKEQISATDAAAAAQTKTIVKIVHDAQTPQQQVAAVAQLSDVPLNARIAPSLVPNGPPQVEVDLAPLVQELGQCKQNAVALGACQSDLKNETAIAGQKDQEIAALKKKPSFWARITSHGKTAAIGIVLFEAIKLVLTRQL